MKGYALFIVWPVVASKSNALIRHFLSCNQSKDSPNKKAISVLEWLHKLFQTPLRDSAAWSCFKKACFLRSLKIHKEFGFKLNLKKLLYFTQFPTKISLSKKHFWGFKHINIYLYAIINIYEGQKSYPPWKGLVLYYSPTFLWQLLLYNCHFSLSIGCCRSFRPYRI